MATLSWPPHDSRLISDNNHGFISLFHPLEAIVNSKEFQRLHELRQLGNAHLVYPTSVHTRFSHSLGTYWLAHKLIDRLKFSDPSLNITSQDHLCVSIAALCHDLGHGPFSHLFDGPFMTKMGKKIKHEETSIKLVRRLLGRKELKLELEPYLGIGEEWEMNVTFICELIHSKKFDKYGNWLPKGRQIEKSFLYDIVSNGNDGIDVDKWDYLTRDSLNTGIGISFNKMSIDRLLGNCRVLKDPNQGHRRICYASTVADELLAIGESRQKLHDLLYQHKSLMSIEELLVQALCLANEYLIFDGDDGKKYRLSESIEDLGAFLRTNDGIYSKISNSTSDELEPARKIIETIERREFPVRISEQFYTTMQLETVRLITDYQPGASISELFEKTILKKMREKIENLQDNEITLITRILHRGFGPVNPMTEVLIYDSNSSKARPVDRKWLLFKSPKEAEIRAIGIYVDRKLDEDRRIIIEVAFKEAFHFYLPEK